MAEVTGFKKGVYTIDYSSDSKMMGIGGAGMCCIFEPNVNN
jgi:hypothetical protein